MEFSKMGESQFPYIDNLKTRENDFDYSQWDTTNMILRCLNVPWDLGEVHVGNRTVSGIGNVVKFESDSKRDAWFESKKYAETPEQAHLDGFDGFQWETQFRTFHQEDEIYIPLPFDVAAQFNYLTVSYNRAPINYERTNSMLKWFYFSRAVEEISPNKTKCIVRRDTWQTYINRISIPWMVLQQGHAPMSAASSVENYLANPIGRTDYLLGDDVSFGDLTRVKHIEAINFGEKAVAVVVCSGFPQGTWGSKANSDWKTPSQQGTQDGVPAYRAFAIAANQLTSFLTKVNSNVPQFIQTVKAVFFINPDLITYNSTFTFCETECMAINHANSEIDLIDLQKNQFGYPSKYANITKLYTFPYSALEVATESGESAIVRIEDTNGELSLRTGVNLAFPFVNIDGRLSGIGGNVGKTLTFRNITPSDFSFDGRWYDFLYKWEIPTFGVYQSASIQNDYATHFQRLQQALENATANANALASNQTTYDNSLASNATSNTNAIDSNETAYSNAIASNATANTNAISSADNSEVNAKLSAVTGLSNFTDTNNLANSLSIMNNNLIIDTTEANIDKVSDDWDSDFVFNVMSTWQQNDVVALSTAINGAQNVINGALGGAATGAMAGSVGIATGAAAGAAGGLASSIVASASVPLTITSNENVAQLSRNLGDAKTAHALANMRSVRDLQTTFNTSSRARESAQHQSIANRNKTTADTIAENNNDTATDIANATKATADSNAQASRVTGNANANRTKTTADANALRSKNTADANANRTKATADAAIVAGIDAAALMAPFEFGTYANGENATIKPNALIANVITQSDDAIARAGDKFLRYGYNWSGNWDFKDFNIMPKFTYWQVSDMWVKGLDVPDLYMDEIRFFLLGGVTVWRNPDDIGETSIYDNV